MFTYSSHLLRYDTRIRILNLRNFWISHPLNATSFETIDSPRGRNFRSAIIHNGLNIGWWMHATPVLSWFVSENIDTAYLLTNHPFPSPSPHGTMSWFRPPGHCELNFARTRFIVSRIVEISTPRMEHAAFRNNWFHYRRFYSSLDRISVIPYYGTTFILIDTGTWT